MEREKAEGTVRLHMSIADDGFFPWPILRHPATQPHFAACKVRIVTKKKEEITYRAYQ